MRTSFWVLASALVLCSISNAVPVTIDRDEYEALRETIASLSETVKSLEEDIREYEKLEGEEEPPKARALQASEPATDPTTVTFEHKDASIEFYRGANIMEADAGLHISSDVEMEGDLSVEGSLTVDGSNLNLGLPLLATANITAGDVLSLAPSGGVAKGFGMQLSSSLTSMTWGEEPSMVRLTDDILVVAYLNSTGGLYVSYYDTRSSAAEAPVPVSDGDIVETFTIAAPSADQLVLCYKKSHEDGGFCRAARYTTSIGFGLELALPSTSTYFSGSLSNLHGASDRVVLMYSMATNPAEASTESTKAQVLSVSGTTVSLLESPRSLVSSKCDHLTSVSLNRFRVFVSYRVVRDNNAEVRELYFREGDDVNILSYSRFNLDVGGADLWYMDLARLSDNMALLVYRDNQNTMEVRARVVDGSGTPLLEFGPESVVDAGSQQTGETLGVSVVAVKPDRVGVSFIDASGNPMFVDGGLFGTSVVFGRPQHVLGGSGFSNSMAATRMTDDSVVFLQQPEADGSTIRGMALQRAVLFGGPTMLGLAKTDAKEGEMVSVLLQGALDGYSNLRPGAPYYARYDGGIGGSPDPFGGTSSSIVGKAVTDSILVSLIGSDGETNAAAIAKLKSTTAVLTDIVDRSVVPATAPLEAAFSDSYVMDPTRPIFRWATWSTYAQNKGWIADNNEHLFAGVHPSNWGDNHAQANQIQSNKEMWVALFNKKIYPGRDAVVCAEEWYYYSSTNSRHCGALFRIRNTKATEVTWKMKMYYSSYSQSGYNERASITLNGADTWHGDSSNCASQCKQETDIAFPPNRISTVIVVVGAGSTSGTRTTVLAFYDKCLALPDGLEYVDDLHINRDGGWES